MLLPVGSNFSGLLLRNSESFKFVLPLSFGANQLLITDIMIQHLQAAFFSGIAILMVGCVKQEDVDALVTAVKANRTDIRDPYIVMLTPAGVYARRGAGMTMTKIVAQKLI